MRYLEVKFGEFSRKLNRFVAEVFIDGQLEKVHIKNTGRLIEVLKPGATVALEPSNNPKRVTRYSIIAAKKEEKWVNIDSQVPNSVVYEALKKGKLMQFVGVTDIKREVRYESSRFDLFYYRDKIPGFIEVKGVTLEQDGVAMFPDAPTTRGTRHVNTLIQAKDEGFEATILFIVQMGGCHLFTPYKDMDIAFYQMLKEAAVKGVQLLAYDCEVTESTIQLNNQIPIHI
ncbi:DNA/RNA nuclease SfsA [Oceanobacillus luteolus]|uniref:Sugar fermentation stimulation protein homolog n=1 Tax=Oceanobacillus luteolus TaxID=1274358 RepID=A0ABW4HXX3_9BACI|nr:DNA/RNA nuclease SfsA [Oceanobacillus luteolus]MCM3740904.1 DNA/RNA nuclease SfsA [Oceanobacillus luteolus]